MVTTWVVVLEATGPDAAAIDVDVVERLLEAVAEADPVALHSDDRYALQLSVAAESAPEALLTALTLWRSAAQRMGGPLWELARAEVITGKEFERERALVDSHPAAESGDEALEALLEEAFHDSLTGVPSPAVFHDRVERAVASGRPSAVLLVDIDDLAGLNARSGLHAGDAALIATARRLHALLRPGDLVARVAGDTFGLVLDDSSPTAASAVADRVVSGASRPLVVAHDSVSVTVSVGVAVAEPSQSAAGLLRNVRAALSRAKDNGGGGYELFSAATPEPGAVVEEDEGSLPAQMAYLGLLERVSTAANTCDTLEDAARVALQQVCAFSGLPVGHLYVRNATGTFEPSSTWHAESPPRFHRFWEATAALTFAADEGIPGAVARAGKPIWIGDLETAGVERFEAASDVGVNAALGVPVLVGDDVVAVLEFFADRSADPNATLLDVLAAVGTQLGRVVERVEAKRALLETEQQLRDAHALAGVGSWQYDLVTKTMTVSSEIYAIYGIDPTNGAPTPADFIAMLHAGDDATAAEIGRLALDEGVGSEYEVRIVRPNGSIRWIATRTDAVRNAEGTVIAVRGSIHDVTDRKLAEEAVRQSEIRWSRMLENSVDIICLLDRDGTVLSAVGPMTGMTGIPVAAAVGANVRDFIHPIDASRVDPIWDHVLRTPGRSGPFEIRIVNLDGGWRWTEAVFNNLLDDPDVGAIVINARDVTERKYAEEQLAQHAEPADRA